MQPLGASLLAENKPLSSSKLLYAKLCSLKGARPKLLYAPTTWEQSPHQNIATSPAAPSQPAHKLPLQRSPTSTICPSPRLCCSRCRNERTEWTYLLGGWIDADNKQNATSAKQLTADVRTEAADVSEGSVKKSGASGAEQTTGTTPKRTTAVTLEKTVLNFEKSVDAAAEKKDGADIVEAAAEKEDDADVVEADGVVSLEADAVLCLEADVVLCLEADAVLCLEADAVLVQHLFRVLHWEGF